MVRILGIVNVTRDSFSDGGRHLDPAAAIAHGERLLADGADALDLGAESTHPDAEDVSVDEELRRLVPVLTALQARGAAISIDTCKPAVMRAVAGMGIGWLNCVHGFRSDAALAAAAAAPASVRFVVMFSRSRGPRAERQELGVDGLLAELQAFAVERVASFAAVGIAADRLVLDPGMGFFLGATPGPSLHVLKHLRSLVGLGLPVLVSVSRKSFVGALTGQPVTARGAGTLAAELWAARAGVAWLRSHDVRALRDALAVEQGIVTAP